MFALFLASPPSKIQLCSLSNERSQKTISVTRRLNDSKAGGDLNAFVSCVNHVVLILTSLHLNEKSREVCIKVRSPPASLVFTGHVTKHTTVKCPIRNTLKIGIDRQDWCCAFTGNQSARTLA